MGISKSARRLATAGLATAVVSGGFLGATAGTAEAATSTATYTCSSVLGSFPVPVSLVTDALTGQIPTGAVVPSDLIPAAGTFELPSALVSVLDLLGLGQFGGTISGFDLSAGDLPLPLDGLTAVTSALPGSGSLPLPVNGTIGGFTAPLPGLYDLSLPDTFSFLPLPGLNLATLTCTLVDGANPVIGQLNVEIGRAHV